MEYFLLIIAPEKLKAHERGHKLSIVCGLDIHHRVLVLAQHDFVLSYHRAIVLEQYGCDLIHHRVLVLPHDD